MLFLENRMQFAKSLEDRPLVRKIQVVVFRQQTFENELMRRTAAKPDVVSAKLDDLVRSAVVLSGQARIAEGCQRIGRDSDLIVLANDDDCGHGLGRCAANGGRRGAAMILGTLFSDS